MAKDYPKTMTLDGTPFTLRMMTADDVDKIIEFHQAMSEADLWFAWSDFSKPEAYSEWLAELEQDRAVTVLMEAGDTDKLAAYGSLHYSSLYWKRHIGELRIMVSSAYRGHGLGQKLARELTLLGRDVGLEKIIVYIAANDQAARRMTEYLDFKPEAILSDWMKGRDEKKHDLLIMSVDLDEIRG